MQRDVEDGVFGRLVLNDDTELWESSAHLLGRAVKFNVGGDWDKQIAVIAPSQRLIGEAERIALRFDEFSNDVDLFIKQQIRVVPGLSEWGDELGRLQVAQVCFFWGDRPSYGEIVFAVEGQDDREVVR